MNKKIDLLDIKILDILVKNSDENHPMTQQSIADKLNTEEYGYTEVERRTVANRVKTLSEFDALPYGVTSSPNDRKGSYVSRRPFENTELRILIDGVLSSRYVDADEAKKLADKLKGLGGAYFQSDVSCIDTMNKYFKADTEELFKVIEDLTKAIEGKKQVSFLYRRFDRGMTLRSDERFVGTPYRLFAKNQRYYVMFYREGGSLRYLRVDKIIEVEILNREARDISQISGYEEGYSFAETVATLPYMYSDKPDMIGMFADENAIDYIIDYFGKNVDIKERGEVDGDNPKRKNQYYVTVTTSKKAMEYWALQFINLVEIVSPDDLVDNIRKSLNAGVTKYINRNAPEKEE